MRNSYLINKQKITKKMLFIILISMLGISDVGVGIFYFPEFINGLSTLIMILSFLGAFLISIDRQIKIQSILFGGFLFHTLIVILSLYSNRVDFIDSVYRINVTAIPLFLIIITAFISKSQNMEKVLNSLLSVFVLWISLQTIGAVLMTYILNGTLLKKNIIISVGSSNFIAALLLICVIYFILLPKENEQKTYKITMFLGIVGIGFTFSFGSMVTFLFIIYLYYINQKKNRLKSVVMLLIISVIMYVVLVNIYNGTLLDVFSNTILDDFVGKTTFKVQQLVIGNYDAAFAGRGAVFESKVELIKRRMLLGYGMNVESAGQIRSHNWILDSLIYTGILGTSVFLILIIYTLIKIRKGKNLINNGNSAYYALLAGVIHGFIEPNFFSKPFDFIWWLIALTTIYSINIKANKL